MRGFHRLIQHRDHDIVTLYTQLLRISPKEKTTRLLISTLSNLIASNKSTFLPAAVQARLPALLSNLKSRHLTDPDPVSYTHLTLPTIYSV